MGDRERRTPKSRGKAIDLEANKPLPELPEDLPKKVKYYMSWRNYTRNVLLEVTNQGLLGTCWTISVNNMIASHLFIHQKVDSLLIFSQRHLFAKNDEKLSTGHLKKYHSLSTYLRDVGLILSTECKCTMDKKGNTTTLQCDKVKGREYYKIQELVLAENHIDETEIINLLSTKGPILVCILMTEEYMQTNVDKIYYGAMDVRKVAEEHLISVTGIGTKNGVHYFEYQNTYGKRWGGDEGFGKFARQISLRKGDKSLIKAYMYPKLMERNFIERR